MLPSQPNQSLIDGLTCLQALAMMDVPAGTRELARMLGMEPTRVNRLLKTLASQGMIEQTPDRKYRPGPGMHVLSAQSLYGSGLLRRAIPHLQALGDTGLSVAMGVLWRTHSCYLYNGAPGVPVNEAIGKTGLYPAYNSVIAAVTFIDSQWDQDSILEALGEEPSEELQVRFMQWVQEVRGAGYLRVVRTQRPLEVTLGVPIMNEQGKVLAGLALTGKITKKDTPALAKRLIEAADLIGQASDDAR